MCQRRIRFFLLSVVVLAFSLVSLTAFAQENKDSDHMKSAKGSVSATGCLQKGDEAGGYYLKDTDGKTWELTSKSVNLGEHVGHQVTVMGSPTHASKAKETKIATDEKKEASGNEHSDLKVSKLEMVSESCK